MATAALAVLGPCGCGTAGEAGVARQPRSPTEAELSAWSRSTDQDARSVGDALVAAFEADRTFPASADGLGRLSAGNRIGSYRPKGAASATICVEHVRQGRAWTFSAYFLGRDGRVTQLSAGTNTGCL